MSILKAWRTPFETQQFPSVWITCPGDLDKIKVFIGFPAEWGVRFERIVGVKVCDETYDNNTRFHVERDEDNFCSYTWEGSPWLKDFNAEFAEGLEGSNINHYVLLGGDYNVEILASGSVQIFPATDAAVT